MDELPQLWNVLRGDMSLVGPRPEVPQYVDLADPLWQRVLAARPGITDPVTLRLRDEEALLAVVAGGDRDRFYTKELLPEKLREYVGYLERRTPRSDIGVLLRTVWRVVVPGREPPRTRAPLEAAQGESTRNG
jgi:lipopolysaccharide/colanic/teichoic acid biosynthesis glycosyltransferase